MYVLICFIQIEYSFQFLNENCAVRCSRTGLLKGWLVFRSVESMGFIFFYLNKAFIFYFFLEKGMSPHQIVRIILNFRLTVYSWHKFNASVGSTNDIFNCMPKWIISQGKEPSPPVFPTSCPSPTNTASLLRKEPFVLPCTYLAVWPYWQAN